MVAMLETVVAETEVKNKSKSLGMKEGAGFWLRKFQSQETNHRNDHKVMKLNPKWIELEDSGAKVGER